MVVGWGHIEVPCHAVYKHKNTKIQINENTCWAIRLYGGWRGHVGLPPGARGTTGADQTFQSRFFKATQISKQTTQILQTTDIQIQIQKVTQVLLQRQKMSDCRQQKYTGIHISRPKKYFQKLENILIEGFTNHCFKK